MARKKKRKPQARNTKSQPQPGLNEASRAQLGPDEEKRPYRPRKDDASVEDPLKDWPEESSG